MVGLADPFDHHSQAGPPIGRRRLRPWQFAVILGLVCGVGGCNNDTSDAATDSQKCAHRLYANYSPMNMKQCVDVCITCERGSMTTCSTSCTMKGAK
jgi:hypothetical protein